MWAHETSITAAKENIIKEAGWEFANLADFGDLSKPASQLIFVFVMGGPTIWHRPSGFVTATLLN